MSTYTYLTRTPRISNPNLNPYRRRIAASTLRPHPARQVQNQRTLWNFSWFTGGSSSSSSSSSVKKDGSGSESSGGSGGKDEVEMNATRGPKRGSDDSTEMMKTKMMMKSSGDSDPAVLQPATTPTSTSTPASTSTPVSSSNSPKSNAPNTTSTPVSDREAKEKAAIQALLDRDGGSLGFEFEDGQPEGGQRRSVKREMFRVI